MSDRPDPGDDLPVWRLADVEPDRMKILALLLADPNPLHYDRAAVVRLGVGDREVNQGPSTMAMAMNALLQGVPGTRLLRFSARLLGNVLAGDAVEVVGRSTGGSADDSADGAGAVTCTFTVRVPGRGDVLTGEAVLVPA